MKNRYHAVIGIFTQEGQVRALAHVTDRYESYHEARRAAVKWLSDNSPSPYKFLVVPFNNSNLMEQAKRVRP